MKGLFTTKFKRAYHRNWSIDDIIKTYESCGLSQVTLLCTNADNTYLTLEGTDEQYAQFSKLVEKKYPGVCVFDI